jgi:predicted lipid-binding transport protein (Tim44 family)
MTGRGTKTFTPQGDAMANDNEPRIWTEIQKGYLRKIGEDAASPPKTQAEAEGRALGSLIALLLLGGMFLYCMVRYWLGLN